MGFFDYKGFDKNTSAELVMNSSKLAIYTNAAYFFGFPGAKILNTFGDSSSLPNKVDISIPKNWREIEPHELGLPASSKDKFGYYTFDSPVFGNPKLTGGPQAKIFGEFIDGKLTKVCMSWCGTNDLLDIADYFHLNSGAVVPPMEPLLNSLKDYSIQNGLTGEDVLVTGYSLGGGLTNLMAKYRETLSDGFYKDSNYFGHASPYIYNNPDVIFNMGYENDAVYRILGDKASFQESYADANYSFVNPDKEYDSTIDNVILFDSAYASPFWSKKLVSLLNKSSGWKAHGNGVRTDALNRILDSEFYDSLDKDSAIIIDNLKAIQRWNTWVKDKTENDVGRPVFIIGNHHNNLLEGGKGSDYIEGKQGNDKIRTGYGFDTVDGGEGIDTLVLMGTKDNWDAYRLNDGSLFMHNKAKLGLVHSMNVEKVSFAGEFASLMRPYDITENELVDNRYPILKFKNKNVSYKEALEGTNEGEYLRGDVVFGKDGNDEIYAGNGKTSLLHGGKGNDIIVGAYSDDELYGAEGNDELFGGAGTDVLYGGVGDDVFIFTKQSTGLTIITDFNAYSGDNDLLSFSGKAFGSANEVLDASYQDGKDLFIHKNDMTIVLQNVLLSELSNRNIEII